MVYKVSAVILNFNNWRDTIACAESVLRLDYSNLILTIVDNCSEDDSAARLKEWIAGKNACFIESPRNLGYAGGNNLGIRAALEARADFIWILNNDTLVEPGALKALLQCAQAEPGAALIGSTLISTDDSIQALGGGYIVWPLGISRHRTRPWQPLGYIHGASIFARAEAIRRIGLLDEHFFLYWEDADWSLRARRAGWKLAHAQESRVRHQEGGTVGRASSFTDYHHARGAYLYFKKNYPGSFWLPGAAMLAGKTITRLIRGDWPRLPIIWRGVFCHMEKVKLPRT